MDIERIKQRMENKLFNSWDLIKHFEQTAGVRFVDVDTGESALNMLIKGKADGASDYDRWLEQQDESVKSEQEMGRF